MVPFAVTLSDLIEKGGAYAGLAAFFGLAILSVLYFAQAREIRRLRDWAGRAPERAQELEQRVVQQAEAARRVTPVPSRRPGEPATAAALAASKPPPEPAADAPTTQQPAVEPEVAEEEKEEAVEAEQKPETETPAPETPETPAAEPVAGEEEEGSPTEHPVVASAPATDAPAEEEAVPPADQEAVPAGATTALAGAASTAPPANGAPPEVPPALPPRATQSPPVRRPAPAAPLRSSTSATRRPPPRGPVGTPPAGGDGDARRTPVVAIAAVAGLVLIVVGLIALIGGDKPKATGGKAQPAPSAAATQGTTTKPSDQKKPPTVARADTNVAVLNGTTVAGLAGTINTRLEQAGYTASQAPTNYTDQARSASVVFYNGSENRTQAIEIAKLLDISDRQPIIDAATQLAPGADVVVVVGADQTP
jgi:hypothetical protein